MIAIVTCIFAITGEAIISYRYWNNFYFNGTLYTAKVWQNSETLNYIKNNQDYNIFTNGKDVLKLYIPKIKVETNSIPRRINTVTLIENNSFADDINGLVSSIDSGKSCIVYFNNITWRKYLMRDQEILKLFKNYEVMIFNDGFIIY